MDTTQELIAELEKFNGWVLSIQNMDENLFFEPIKEGKWSPAEIITHITFWDRYILEEILPAMKQDAEIVSAEFETINLKASQYALSGIPLQQIIQNQIMSRNNIVTALKGKTEEDFFARFTLNGEEIDSYSGYPHTMFNYFASFVWHDNHHKKQVENFLSERHVEL